MLPTIFLIFVGCLKQTQSANFPLLPQLNLQDFIQEQILLGALNPLSSSKYYGPIIPDALDPVLELEDITFNLFTKDNPEDAYPLQVGDVANLRRSPFRSQVATKIIIHGWTDSTSSNWVKDFRHNYLIIEDYNIICVDWFPVSAKEYSVAAKLTRQVGDYVGELIRFLKLESDTPLSKVHILGHSLGAHIAGFAGSKLSGTVGRITGMDPARPLFETPILKDPSDRLDPSDAVFVDVIHTCAGSVGFIRPVGHADFYPNGGTCTQPGCPIIVPQYCSHQKSHVYMLQSITHPDQFQAIKCLSWMDFTSGNCLGSPIVHMGEFLSPDTRGVYFLTTSTNKITLSIA
ncbi:pancreatic triacylglycerol lipase-like [Chelonus insularis]|uniref:pancreatic triacylglycerol lipase-like n=1 Tax=Chelonus insularis TaxID=460826 RepID=UPI0015889706|nr:pancreatic triacylglycerol lipase-like [Chelonus insularis]XP_034945850.1 pancreatic triacylglycerol lipase-like [Chelonus insularis]